MAIINDVFHEIHPPQFELKKENTSLFKASPLDLNIKNSDKKFKLGLYDNRNSFSFSIVRKRYLSCHVPH